MESFFDGGIHAPPCPSRIAAQLLACALPAHAADTIAVTVTLTNTGNTPQRLLKWRTPFVPAEHALFQITRDQLPVRYLGRQVKRAAPTEAVYAVLASGESRSARVELQALRTPTGGAGSTFFGADGQTFGTWASRRFVLGWGLLSSLSTMAANAAVVVSRANSTHPVST